MPDLIDIAGLAALRSHTKGDPRIKIAVLDGAIDLDRACFQGANITRLEPYWAEEFPIDPQDLQAFLEIESTGKSEDEKKEMMEEAFPDENIFTAIHLICHANHIISTICGQPDSPVEGIAPNATVINIPIAYGNEDFINPLNLSRAISTAIEQGANIIHCAACHPTQSGLAHEFIEKAIRQAQENNILVIAPGGNDKGECWCIPAVLDNVLTVGAMKDTGEPFKFSNFGGKYASQGILAPGENILGAQPSTDEPIRKKGTSCAAPIVTGTAALLMSLQLAQGAAPDAEAVRAALTNSAIPCDPNEVEEPERCLLGRINIAGAYELLTGENLQIAQQASPDNSQHRQKVKNYYNSNNSVIVEDVGKTYQAGLLVTDADDPFLATNLFQANRAGIKPEDYVLDAGCGAGGPAIDLAQNIPGVKIEGITISEEQARSAQKLIGQAGLEDRVRIQVGDYHNLAFDDNVFDVVYFFESISYTDDPFHLFTEIYRVLRPGGTIYMKDVFSKESPLSEQEKKDLAEFERIYAIAPSVSLTQMAEEVKQAGFEEVEWHDLSEVVSTEQFLDKMHKSTDGEQHITNFGKSHYYQFEDLPILFGDIKASKPLLVSTTYQKTTLSDSEIPTPVIASNVATLFTSTQPTIAIAPSNASENVTLKNTLGDNNNILPSSVTPSQRSNLVYALGTLGYDFGTEARRDTFKQFMPAIDLENMQVPANPYDARQMVDYLETNLSETKSLIWTLNLEMTPLYAIKPVGAFGADIYEMMMYMLAGQVLAEDNEDYIERVSIPGMLTDETVRLFSGQIVPLLKVNSPRGMYGWKVNTLIDSALQTVSEAQETADESLMRRSLSSFLNRVYYDLRNLGQIARDRALNFAATNAFQAVQTFSEAVAIGMELHSIDVEKSPFCRYGSECWDVKLKFFDPDHGLRAKIVFRFTIDVSDRTPVTLGEVRSWAVSK